MCFASCSRDYCWNWKSDWISSCPIFKQAVLFLFFIFPHFWKPKALIQHKHCVRLSFVTFKRKGYEYRWSSGPFFTLFFPRKFRQSHFYAAQLLVSCPEVVFAFKSRVLGLAVAIGKPTPVKLFVVWGQSHAKHLVFRRNFPK